MQEGCNKKEPAKAGGRERAERIIKPKRQKWNEMEKELKLKKGFLLYILSFSTLLHNDPAALQDQNFSLT